MLKQSLWGCFLWFALTSQGCYETPNVTTECASCPERCKEGKCATCLNDSHCRGNDQNSKKKCTEDNQCVCGDDSDCGPGLYCFGKKGCKDCRTLEHCLLKDPRFAYCAENVCLVCNPGERRACEPPEGISACGKGEQFCRSGGQLWGACQNWQVCKADEECQEGQCVKKPCSPRCEGKVCGDDGCGGNCGNCGKEERCSLGLCKATTCDPPCGECLQCLDGQCVALPDDLACGTQDGSCQVGACFQGSCQTTNRPDGTTCGVGKMCLTGRCIASTCSPPCQECQRCDEGVCLALPKDSPCQDDGNPCTRDLCDGGRCVHSILSDGAVCASGKLCQQGQCLTPRCPEGNGDYCGESVGKTKGILYSCKDGIYLEKQVCSLGCEIVTNRDDRCLTCSCDPPQIGPWSSCQSQDVCAFGGEQSRQIASYTCVSGQCQPTTKTETKACTRSTDGMPCSNGTCQGGVCVCLPKTCTQLGKSCGTWPDGCGMSLNCPPCSVGQSCNSSGQCVSSCQPKTCGQLGKTCGSWPNGCGGSLSCGNCPSGQSCDVGVCNCSSGTTLCGGQCVDLNQDTRHCGGCFVPCFSNQTCQRGHCQSNLPDLRITSISGPTSMGLKIVYFFDVRVEKTGGLLTQGTEVQVRIYLSSDSSISTNDLNCTPSYEGKISNSVLNTSGAAIIRVMCVPGDNSVDPIAKGTWYLGGFVDPVNLHNESNESNNSFFWQQVVIN